MNGKPATLLPCCQQKTSINVQPSKPVSEITQTVTSGFNIYPSSSWPTMSSIQSKFVASNSLPTNSKKEDPNPDHDPFRLSLGKQVLHGTPNETSMVLCFKREWIQLNQCLTLEADFVSPSPLIFSNLWCNHPQNHVCSIRLSHINFQSIQSSPIHFCAPLCGHEEECSPHTNHETSNQSFETFQTERIHGEKISERSGQIRSSTKTGREMPFFSKNKCSEQPNHYSTMRFSVNDPGIVLSKGHDRNAVCLLNMTQKTIKWFGLGIIQSWCGDFRDQPSQGGALLMPTAGHVSTYNMGMTSASTGSQFITERSHDSNMNHINPVSRKEACESESVSCPTSDRKESREHCSTAEWMDTSVEIRSSAYSNDERLWNDVNQLSTIMDWSVDNEICHHQAQHG